MASTPSNPFIVQVVAPAVVNKPGDAIPPLAKLVDPFEKVSWTVPQAGIIARNGIATKADVTPNIVFINLDSVWFRTASGIYRYWNRVNDAWQWDGGHGRDGNFY